MRHVRLQASAPTTRRAAQSKQKMKPPIENRYLCKFASNNTCTDLRSNSVSDKRRVRQMLDATYMAGECRTRFATSPRVGDTHAARRRRSVFSLPTTIPLCTTVGSYARATHSVSRAVVAEARS